MLSEKVQFLVVLVSVTLFFCIAFTRNAVYAQEGAESYDQDAAASHHYGHVKVKVYRGPTVHGHHDHHFAPHGYWIKQPADHH